MSTVPLPGGLVAVTCVPESAVTVPGVPPKLTPVAPERPVPLMVTLGPARGDPLAGDTPVTAGGAAAVVYVKWSAAVAAEVPTGVVTLMSTVPAPAGLVTVICVPESAVTVAVARPKLTRVAPERPVPVMVTLVPPAGDPPAGHTPVTAGSNECEPAEAHAGGAAEAGAGDGGAGTARGCPPGRRGNAGDRRRRRGLKRNRLHRYGLV